MFEINNKDNKNVIKENFNIFVSGYSLDSVMNNVLFKNVMKGFNIVFLIEGGVLVSSFKFIYVMYVISIDVIDSLGIKYVMCIEFYRSGGVEWNFRVIVFEFGELVGGLVVRFNVFEGGCLYFNNDGLFVGMNLLFL